MKGYQRQEFEEAREQFKEMMEDRRWKCFDQGQNKSFCTIGDVRINIEIEEK